MSESQATSFLEVKYPNLFLVFLLAALLPYLLLPLYIHPVADDFIYALKGENFFKNLWRDYLTWNGRYTSNIIVFFNNALVKHTVLYKLYPVVLIALLILSAYWLLNISFQHSNTKKENLIFSLVLVLLFLNLMPKESEGLYWFTGSATYILPCVFLLAYLRLVISYFRRNFLMNKYFHLASISSLLFLLCGFNEVLTMLLALLHLFASVFLRNKHSNRAFFILIIAAVTGFILMSTAPGNSIRSINFPDRHQFFHSVLYSVLQTARFSSTWILSPALLLVTLIYLPIATRQSFSSRVTPFIMIFALLGVIFFSAFAPYWSTGVLGQHRTINLACFLFLLCWFFALPSFCQYIPQSFFEIIQSSFFQSAAVILLVITFFITRNGLTSWSDLISGEARQYDTELNSRNALLLECKKQGPIDCIVPVLTAFPKSIFVLDIQPQSTSWINIDYARYYGLNSVSIQE